ncbi:signal transduction histidine kinase [Sporomusaceae bacterium FL31]|nr:signal transduction histidine kinase [Sporomusaceae bacterium FL31]GCE32476.1 signal transduction histidine kinase [Sporomusaceae bacterium]
MTTEAANKEVCDELVRVLRIQRHDFINHIQVIHALLQLGRVEKALKYIEDLAKDPNMMSNPLRMNSCPVECQRKAVHD